MGKQKSIPAKIELHNKKDKVLLISYYWYPWNNPGTFRWYNFGKYFNFDVLTCRRPLRSFMDVTIETRSKYDNTRSFGAFLPAVIWGLFAPFVALFVRADVYVISSPPESMLIGAWFLQKLRKSVLIDMRDSIDREKQFFPILIPIYKWFYNKLKNVVVAYKFIDDTKPVVYHGYENIKCYPGFQGVYQKRVNRKWYLFYLERGYMPDQSKKPENYAGGSLQTLRYLGFPIGNHFHPEVYDLELVSTKESAIKMKNIITALKK